MTNTLPSFAGLFGDISNPDALQMKILELDTIVHPYMLKLKKSANSEIFDASTNPFFQPARSVPIDVSSCITSHNYKDFYDIFDKYKNVNFNKALLLLYVYTGSVKKQIITEHGWTLFSIAQIFDRYKDNQKSLWIDIGLVYRGLGHVYTLRMDVRNGELFMQPDGGSNGWDCEMYYNKYVNQVPDISMYQSITDVLNIIVDNCKYDG